MIGTDGFKVEQTKLNSYFISFLTYQFDVNDYPIILAGGLYLMGGVVSGLVE